MKNLKYQTKEFKDLSLDELYGILRLRVEIFVIEQNCPYQDLDNKDQKSLHVIGKNEQGDILAYTRIVPLGISYPKYVSIGRVVVSDTMRGTGEGKRLMENSIAEIKKRWKQPIKISAQCYLDKFYTELGFQATGEEYLEDDIPHMAMIYQD